MGNGNVPVRRAALGIGVRRVKQLIQARSLRPARKVGNYNVFRRADIEAYARTPRPVGRPPHRRDPASG